MDQHEERRFFKRVNKDLPRSWKLLAIKGLQTLPLWKDTLRHLAIKGRRPDYLKGDLHPYHFPNLLRHTRMEYGLPSGGPIATHVPFSRMSSAVLLTGSHHGIKQERGDSGSPTSPDSLCLSLLQSSTSNHTIYFASVFETSLS